MSKISNIWVFSDAESRLAEAIAGAATLGEKVSAFVIGAPEAAARAFALGADAVCHLGERDDARIVEAYADTMAKVIAEGDGPALVLLPGTRRCKALASLLGVRLDAGVVTEAAEVAAGDGGVQVRHMVYGGLALGCEKVASKVAIVVFGGGVFQAAEPDASRTGEAVAVDFVAPKAAITCVSRQPKQGSSVNLTKAKRIVAVGRGIGKKEDIQLAENLCAAIEAELGCSRPIAEGEKWMEHERYIGISGVMPKPELYLALGISGQVQHMVGANGAQTIVAVNKDKNAPIFQYADYGIVGDLYTVVPALVAAFKAQTGAEQPRDRLDEAVPRKRIAPFRTGTKGYVQQTRNPMHVRQHDEDERRSSRAASSGAQAVAVLYRQRRSTVPEASERSDAIKERRAPEPPSRDIPFRQPPGSNLHAPAPCQREPGRKARTPERRTKAARIRERT